MVEGQLALCVAETAQCRGVCAAVRPPRRPQIVPNMLAHPPWDKTELDREGRPFYLLHLTYPCRYDKVPPRSACFPAVWTLLCWLRAARLWGPCCAGLRG